MHLIPLLIGGEELGPSVGTFGFTSAGPDFVQDPSAPQEPRLGPGRFFLSSPGPLVAPPAISLQRPDPMVGRFGLRSAGPSPVAPRPPVVVYPPDVLIAPEIDNWPAKIEVSGVADLVSATVTPSMNENGQASGAARTAPAAGSDRVVTVGGAAALYGVVTEDERDKVDDTEYRRTHSFSIVGHLREFEEVVVWPDFGGSNPDRLGSPVQDTRFFDFTMNGSVTVEDDYPGSGTVGRDVMAAALDPDPLNRIAPPDHAPDNFAQWMWSSLPGQAPIGWNNFRLKTPSGTGLTSVWMAVYDYGELWIDGVQMLVCEQAGVSQHIEVDLSAHSHLIVIKAYNGGGRAAVWTTGMSVSGGMYGDALWRSSSGWLSSGYERNPRPLTIGGVLLRLLSEAKRRGELTGWAFNFSSQNDSLGRPWPKQEESLTHDVGMSYKQVLESYGNLVDYKVINRTLHVVNKGGIFPGGGPDWSLGVDLMSSGSQGHLR